MRRTLILATLAVALLVLGAAAAHAEPVLEPKGPPYDPSAPAAARQLPRGTGTLQVYGRLAVPGAVDLYAYTAASDGAVQVELDTPAWLSLGSYRPAALVVPMDRARGIPAESLPTLISSGSAEVLDPGLARRQTFIDPYSATRYYRGGTTGVSVKKGVAYAIIVFSTERRAGAYRLAIGSPAPAPPGAGLSDLSRLVRLKLGLYGGGGPDPGVLLFLLADLAAAALVAALAVWLWRRSVTRSRPSS